MNWLLIVISIFLTLCALNGYRVGFVKKLFTTVSFIITIVASSALTPYISDFLISNTSLHSAIKEGTIGIIEETKENNNEQDNEEDIVKAIPLPSIVKGSITTKEDGDFGIVDSIYEYIGGKLADTIVNAISFAIAFLVITFVLRTTIFTLDIIANLPIIKGINQYAGLLLGAGEGVVIVWVLFLIIMVMGNTKIGGQLTHYIEDSQFLSFLYNYNYFFKLF